MSAPVDAAVGVIAAVGFVCGGLLLIQYDPWKRRMERRVAAIEAPSGAREAAASREPDAVPKTFEHALIELRDALALFDLSETIVRHRSKDRGTTTEVAGRAYAAWTLALAAERLAAAYVRDADAETARRFAAAYVREAEAGEQI